MIAKSEMHSLLIKLKGNIRNSYSVRDIINCYYQVQELCESDEFKHYYSKMIKEYEQFITTVSYKENTQRLKTIKKAYPDAFNNIEYRNFNKVSCITESDLNVFCSTKDIDNEIQKWISCNTEYAKVLEKVKIILSDKYYLSTLQRCESFYNLYKFRPNTILNEKLSSIKIYTTKLFLKDVIMQLRINIDAIYSNKNEKQNKIEKMKKYLTNKELEVFYLIISEEEPSNKVIADKLYCSEKNIEAIISGIKKKYIELFPEDENPKPFKKALRKLYRQQL